MQIEIHYHRPPDRTTIFRNELVHAAHDVVITWMPATPLPAPLIIEGRTALDPDAPAVWFTFPGLSYDIGRFHRRDGTFTGIYANMLTPVEFTSDTEWRTTDLFLDLWLDTNGRAILLDEAELEVALARGWLDPQLAEQARATALRLLADCREGTWPPPVVYEWPLERIRGKS